MGDTTDQDRYYYEPPKTFVKSAVRSIAVLEYFYRTRQPARAIEISQDLQLPVSSTKYLLESLAESGYLIFDKQAKTYFPSMQLVGFASWLSGVYPNGEILRSIARDLHHETGELVYIMVQHDQYMRAFIVEMEGIEKPAAYDFRVRIPMVGSASGGAALSTLSDKEVLDIARRESRRLPPGQREEQCDHVLEKIRQFRRQGFAINFGGTAKGYQAVAIPLPRTGNIPCMVLGVLGSPERLQGHEAALAERMRGAVAKHRDSLQPQT
jgi:DNA-binding IclR family transcriptional regulator